MIPVENKRRSVHPRLLNRLPSPHCWEKVAAGTLRSRRTWCWGGREGKKEAGRGKWKRGIFFPPLTEAVHRWVGPDRRRAGCISGGLSRLQPEERLALWGFWSALSKNLWGVYISDPCEPQHLHKPTEMRPEFHPCCLEKSRWIIKHLGSKLGKKKFHLKVSMQQKFALNIALPPTRKTPKSCGMSWCQL